MPQTSLPNIGVNYEYTLGSNAWKNGFDSSMVILDSQVQACPRPVARQHWQTQ